MTRLLVFILALFLMGCATNPKETGGITNVTPIEAAALLDGDPAIVILDVRTPAEFTRGHIPGAINANYFSFGFGKKLDALDTEATYLVHCKSGHRSARVPKQLAERGVATIYHLDGGFDAWRAAQLPTTK